jgi:DNA-binding NtrC family response regulator
VPETALYPLQAQNGVPGAADAAPSQAQPLISLKTFLRDQEQAYLNRALQQCGGDKERAAIVLGVSLATLYRKLSGDEKEA